MLSIMFHFLTFSAGKFLLLLARKKYYIPSGCLFYTLYDSGGVSVVFGSRF
jgi:hypothetical protein